MKNCAFRSRISNQNSFSNILEILSEQPDLPLELDLGPLCGEGDGHIEDTGHFAQALLNLVDAAAAGHALQIVEKNTTKYLNIHYWLLGDKLCESIDRMNALFPNNFRRHGVGGQVCYQDA